MTGFRRFDVLTALFPFVDVDVRKPRPVAVLSSARFNALNGHVVCAMITTGAGSRWPDDHAIADLAEAGLRHPSIVRWKIFTLADAQIGSLSNRDRNALAALRDEILCGPDATAP